MTRVAYLCSPYSHPDKRVMARRFIEVCEVAGDLMTQGVVVYSPIAHSHVVAEHSYLPPQDHEFWMRQCLPMVGKCDELIVLMLEGWEESRGIRAEVAQAALEGVPVRYMEA